MAAKPDPWEEMGDLDGIEKYRLLRVSRTATTEEIKTAYRGLARRHHPDKGGDAALFTKIQDAFETLSSKPSRRVYDDWASQVQYNYVPSQRQAHGGEDILLEELASSGVLCNPLTQLIVLCEVCGRPSNKECWTCKMPICSFCTLKRHWREGFALHWPLINSDHMKTQLAQREFEKKRIEDARMLDMEDPNWRSEVQLADMRAFKAAALDMQKREDRFIAYDHALARFYMWAQTEDQVFVAMHIPTGYEDRGINIDCNEQILRVQVEGSPPLVERAFDGQIDSSRRIESFKTLDNRIMVISLPKQRGNSSSWPRLFKGDSDGLRCLQPPYRLAETERDVTLEVDIPYLFETEDIRVGISEKGLKLKIEDYLSCSRQYWQPGEEKDRAKFVPVNAAGSMWCLDENVVDGRVKSKTLLVIISKPEANEDEVTWKKGQRQDNLNGKRPHSQDKRGFRFFQDDEDEFGLEDILQAICFLQTGETFVPAKPWQPGTESRMATELPSLSKEVQTLVKNMLEGEEKTAK